MSIKESDYDALCRMVQKDNLDELAAAFRDLPTQMQSAGKMADALSPPKAKKPLPSDQDFASGSSYL